MTGGPGDTGKRKVTSAIPGLTVAEVRKCLDKIKKAWQNRREAGFDAVADVTPDFTMLQFSFAFVLGQHRKRHAKTRQ